LQCSKWKRNKHSYAHKKILNIFFRWLKLGSREFKDVDDPPEIRVQDSTSKEYYGKERSVNPGKDYRNIIPTGDGNQIVRHS